MKTYLVTGAAGFIGFHVSRGLLARGDRVVGLDNVNDYYDVTLKEDRLRILEESSGFRFYRDDLADQKALRKIFSENSIQVV
ncbi:MAG: NAD-dependent epimerase/dehydratase family protein, partial [candidate division Zixibacteria bacterium]|nr:NAD-dependent epimerase/dehydratase family protein [candidate division Zixibacteria bacterium]